MGLMKAPRRTRGTLAATPSKLVRTLAALKEQRQAAGA